jgi:hypothetical protein
MSQAKWEYMARSVQLFPEGDGPVRSFHVAKERGASGAIGFDAWLTERAAEGWEPVTLNARGDLHHDVYVVLRREAKA